MTRLISLIFGTKTYNRSLIRNSYPANRPDLRPKCILTWGGGDISFGLRNYYVTIYDRKRWQGSSWSRYVIKKISLPFVLIEIHWGFKQEYATKARNG